MSRRRPKGDGVVKRLRLWLRALRKDARRYEREKRLLRTTRLVTIPVTRNISHTVRVGDYRWFRYATGLSRGTIL